MARECVYGYFDYRSLVRGSDPDELLQHLGYQKHVVVESMTPVVRTVTLRTPSPLFLRFIQGRRRISSLSDGCAMFSSLSLS